MLYILFIMKLGKSELEDSFSIHMPLFDEIGHIHGGMAVDICLYLK